MRGEESRINGMQSSIDVVREENINNCEEGISIFCAKIVEI